MDYVTELENAIRDFNAEARNLANYREMMSATKTLIAAIQNEKNLLKKAASALQALTPVVENGNVELQDKYAAILNVVETAKADNKTIKDEIEVLLQGFIEREDFGRKNLAEQVKAKIKQDTEALSEKLVQPLEGNLVELQNNCAKIQALIDHEQKAINNNERVVAAFQESLNDCIKAQTDAVNGFLKQIEDIAKVSIEDNAKKMQVILDNTGDTIIGEITPKIDDRFDNIRQKLDNYFDSTNNNMINLNGSINNMSAQIADRITSSDSKVSVYFDGANAKFEQLIQNNNRVEKSIIDAFNNVATENSGSIIGAIEENTNRLVATRVELGNLKDELTKAIDGGDKKLETEIKNSQDKTAAMLSEKITNTINSKEEAIAYEIKKVNAKVNQNRIMMVVLTIIAAIILFKLW